MNKKRIPNNQATTRSGSDYYSLRLAIATATLGMALGISPGDTLASKQQQINQETKKIVTAAPDKIKKPGAVYPKVKRPNAVYPKVNRPGAMFPKVENPGAAFPKVENPGAEFIKIDRQ